MKSNEVENQRILASLVDREIVACCSQMFHEVSQMHHDDHHLEECISALSMVEEWEGPGFEHAQCQIDDLRTEIELWQDECEELKTSKPDDWEIDLEEKENDISSHEDEIFELESIDDWQDYCQSNGIDCYYREVFEHWIVTPWMAARLQDHGEAVENVFDFMVWGRTTTGQSIALDGVIGEIASGMGILVGQKSSWAEDTTSGD